MKILLLADKMDIGGAETHIYELSRSLSLTGHEVRIFSEGGRTANLLSGEVGLIYSGGLRHFPISLPRAARRLLAALRDFKPDVVHAHTRKSLFLANAALKIAPFPLVFTAHAKFSNAFPKRLLTNPPSETIAVSPDIGDDFKNRFGARSVTVIPNGIDTNRFSPCKTPKSPLKILHVSRLDADCSLCAELLCRVAPRLNALFPDFCIRIVGGGGDLDRIKELASRANAITGRKAVVCVGAVSDVLPHIKESNLFVGVSRAALEAMACGLPSVICGNEGYFGICRQDNFDLCAKENFCARGYPKPDGDRLFDDLVALAKSLGDKKLILKDRIASDFNSLTMAQRTEAIYKKAREEFYATCNKVVICGYYGFFNLGDELVLERIKEALSPLQATVIGARGGGRIWRFNPFGIAKALRSSSLFLLGGGSLLQNSTSNRSLFYYLSMLKAASFFGRRTMLYANGFGPIGGERAKRRCEKALVHVDVASFRDRGSLSRALPLLHEGTRAYQTCDPALTPIPAREKKDRIALFIRGEDCKKELLSCLKTFFQAKGRGVFASMNKKSDLGSCKKAAEKTGLPFLSLDSFEDASAFIASSRLVISSRLHALVLAASAGVPFIALCHDPKLSAFAECFSMPTVDIHGANLPKKLASAFDFVVENYNELSQKETEITLEASKMAEKDKKELFALLNF